MIRRLIGEWKVVRVVLCLGALGAAAPAAGQATTEPRVWAAVSVRSRVGTDSPWRWASDSLVRTKDGAGALDFLAGQFVVTRDLTRRSSAGIGYVYGVGFSDAGSRPEHQFVQQFTWSTGTSRVASFRTSLDERFVTGQDAMSLRLREQVRVTWPLAASGRLRGVVSDEVFARANSTSRSSRGFDNNRLFVGIAQVLTPRSWMEFGYLNVYSRPGSGRSLRSHVVSASLGVSL